MNKWIIYIILSLLTIGVASAIIDCEGPTLTKGQLPCLIISSHQFSCGGETIKIFNEEPTLIRTADLVDYGASGRCNITFGIADNETASGSYLLNWSNGDSAKLIVTGKDDMASLSITLFIGALTLTLFYLGIKKDFSHSALANLIIKRCMILGGMFLVSLDTAIMITIADNAGLGIDRELFRYLWGINWVIYFLMLWLAWTTVVNGIKLMENAAKEKRMGSNGEDRYY